MTDTGKLAFVFPGQGSQALGMLAELAAVNPLVEETFAEASEAVGKDLWTMSQQGPEADLNSTENTQPALLAAGVAVWRVWSAADAATPALLAGHSLGEYSALVAAGSIDLSDAAALVAERGRLMQQSVPEGQGAMAAILGLEDQQVEEVCRQAAAGEVVSAANLNSPGQVVIAGASAAVKRAMSLAKEAGARRALPLAVSVPSHCALMKPAAEALAERLKDIEISRPEIPVLHNADVASHDDADAIRDALVRQLYQPVRWVETVQAMAAQGVTRMAECGPGKVLAGLNRRIDRGLETRALIDPSSVDDAVQVWL
jgi:[acyl-carrier-protein] S-malonyltransferase